MMVPVHDHLELVPGYTHVGGDWWISAMAQTWYWIAHLASRAHYVEYVEPVPLTEKCGPVVVATGGNEPRQVARCRYCKCGRSH